LGLNRFDQKKRRTVARLWIVAFDTMEQIERQHVCAGHDQLQVRFTSQGDEAERSQ
jgi:hypothetical protein